MASLIFSDPDERIPYLQLPKADQLALHDWLTDHRVDYARVPVYAEFERDDATNEWRIPVYWVDERGRMRIDLDADPDGTLVRQLVIRRRELRPLPWPTYGPPRVWFNGVEIEGVSRVEFGGES